MKKTVLPFIIALAAFSSCKKESAELIVPDPVVNYAITDSMRVSAFTMTNFPQVYNNYNNRIYGRETTKIKSNYKVEGADIILVFQDTSVVNLGTTVTVKIPNKNLSNITGTYSAQVNDIFVTWGQTISATAAFNSAGYFKVDAGNIQLSYDDRTKTLSGNITNLKYHFGIFVPYYQAGSPVASGLNDHLLLEADGSFRKHTITFQYIKPL